MRGRAVKWCHFEITSRPLRQMKTSTRLLMTSGMAVWHPFVERYMVNTHFLTGNCVTDLRNGQENFFAKERDRMLAEELSGYLHFHRARHCNAIKLTAGLPLMKNWTTPHIGPLEDESYVDNLSSTGRV